MLNVMSANIQGLCPSRGKYKIKMIEETAIDKGISIIALTESHLNSSYHEGEVSIEGFDLLKWLYINQLQGRDTL